MKRRDTGFPPAVRELILARSGGHCEIMAGPWCTLRVDQIHHRRPRGAGGTRRDSTNQPSNGLAACSMCHSHLESHRATAYKHGWLVTQVGKPIETPVMWRGRQVLLDDLGGVVDQEVPW